MLTLVSVSPPGRSGEGLAAGCGWPLLHPLPAADGGAEAGIYRYNVCDHYFNHDHVSPVEELLLLLAAHPARAPHLLLAAGRGLRPPSPHRHPRSARRSGGEARLLASEALLLASEALLDLSLTSEALLRPLLTSEALLLSKVLEV